MTGSEIKKAEKKLGNAIECSLTSACMQSIADCLPDTPHEPDIVAAILSRLPNDLYNSLTTYFPNDKFRVSSMFCHQKPTVDIGLSVNPELADLLIVIAVQSNDGTEKYNSLLLQAKKSKKDTLTVAITEEHQLKLYTEWPDFKYHRAGLLNGVERKITPKVASNGAQYLLLTGKCDSGACLKSAFAEKHLSASKSLSDVLIDMLRFSSGRSFEGFSDKTSDDWTKMIRDLMTINSSRTFTRKHCGIMLGDRVVEENGFSYICKCSDNFVSNWTNLDNNEHFDLEFAEGQEEYMPFLFIECQEGV